VSDFPGEVPGWLRHWIRKRADCVSNPTAALKNENIKMQ
jgi:hypothetical protein